MVGPNGSGKSTLLRTLAGQLRPSSGRLTLAASGAGGVGLLPQSFDYPCSLRLEAFLRYAGWLAGTARDTRASRMDEVLTALNLQEHRRQRLGRLSGGTVRRAGMAAVLMGDPQLLLLDEPTTGVDPVERVAMRRIIAEQAEQRTVVLSSHIAEDIQELSDDVLILDSGRQAFFGPITQLHPEGSARDFEQTLLSYTDGAGKISGKSSGKDSGRQEGIHE